MSSMAPDWRVIGSAPVPGSEAAPARTERPLVSMRQLALGATVVVALLVLGAMGALLVMPGTGGVVVDPAAVEGSWTSRVDPADGPDLTSIASMGARPGSGPQHLVVDVEGAVVRPGLVSVPPGGRVGDAVELAGGFAANVDLEATAGMLNLAQEVTDGLKVVVPAIGAAAPVSGGTGTAPDAAGGPIDLNRASEAQLDSLPGVGPATIAKIVAAREEMPFATTDELRSRGIVGEATYDKLRELVTVGR
jgi:competence protein ComEA